MYAAISKLLDYQKFAIQIGQSPLFTGLGEIIPWLVISIEMLISALLIIPRFQVIGFYAAFSLMVMFTTYIAVILNYSNYVPCSCGGILENLGWTEHLILNASFVILSLTGIILQHKQAKHQSACCEVIEV
jgi:uncharacterized membrane protein YphA (DoxX/SURF4 family)